MSRIINRQRMLAEQGRLRLGYTVPAKTRDGRDIDRPVRSETWILTSHSREHIEHAAGLWGGEPHEWEPMGNGAKQWRVITTTNALPAILPPGDPLTQAYEQWNKGGCVRRCNGATEQFSGNPCLCLAQFGEAWYEQSAKDVCTSKSRLKVLLPDMPGLGSWRMETGSFYATDEIAGMVDTIRGAVGPTVLVPVTLRIEPRTRVAGGETKQFVVPVVELRGVTAGALLSGQAIESGALRPVDAVQTPAALASGSAPVDEWTEPLARLAAATTVKACQDLWHELVEAGMLGQKSTPSPRQGEFVEAFKTKGRDLNAGHPEPKANADGTYDAEVVEDQDGDADAVWERIVATGGPLGLSLPDLQDGCAEFLGGVSAETASAAELTRYLEHLKAGAAA